MARRIAAPESARQRLGPWYSDELLESAPLLQGSFFGWLFGLSHQAAITINGTVHFTAHTPDLESNEGIVLLGHEYFHVVQQQEMGWWWYLIRYVWRWRPSQVKDGRKHPLEAQAYTRGDEICRALAR